MTTPLAFSTPIHLRASPPSRKPLPSPTLFPTPTIPPRPRRPHPHCTQALSPSSPPDRLSLSGRLAVVTGGHRGLGASITLTLASRGADVIVLDRLGPLTSPIPSSLTALNRSHWSVTADLADVPSLRVAASAVLDIAGKRGVDILVNNAGVTNLAPLTELSVDDWDATMAVNVRAPFLLTQMIVGGPNGMIARGRGAIVNVSSVAGTGALEEHGAYCASKAGLDMLTKVMTTEWAALGVRANSVAPTVVLTEMGRRVWGEKEKGERMLKRIPQGRFVEMWEVAEVVAFLASDASAMVNGQVVAVDGGFLAI